MRKYKDTEDTETTETQSRQEDRDRTIRDSFPKSGSQDQKKKLDLEIVQPSIRKFFKPKASIIKKT